MKTLIITISMYMFLSNFTIAQNTGIKINSYAIEAKADKNSDAVDITLTCSMTAQENIDNAQFIFSSEAKIKKINCLKENELITLTYKVNGKDSLLLSTEDFFTRGNSYSVKFEYSFPTGILNDTLTMLDRGHRWYPLIMDQIAPFKLTCVVPAGYSVLSAGNFISKSEGENNTFIYESQLPVFKIPLIIFNPVKFKKSSGSIADFYYYSADTLKIIESLKYVDRIMRYHSTILGDYGQNRLTLIEVKEYPGVNVCSGLLMVGAQSLEAICRGYKEILDLASVQQWFSAGVYAQYGEKGFSFLTISLPHYIRMIYLRLFEGEEVFNKTLCESVESYHKIVGTEKDIPLIEVGSPNTREKGIILYAKGPYILGKIENEMGRNRFENFLKLLYTTFKGKILTFAEFEKYMGMADDSGRSLRLFKRLMSEKGI